MKSNITIEQIKTTLSCTQYRDFNIEKVEEGLSTDVFKLSSNDSIYFLRVLPEDEPLEFQLLAHSLILKKGVKIPKIVFSQERSPILNNKSFMIVTAIPGKSVSNSKKLSTSQLYEILFEAGKELALINSIEVQGIGWLEKIEGNKFIAESDNYNDFVINENMTRLEELDKENIINSTSTQKIKEYIQKNDFLFDLEKNSYLAHGDFANSHIFQLNGKYTGIIDFGDIRGTTKFHDLAHYYMFHPNQLPLLIKGYNTIFKLPSNYMNRIKIEATLFAIGKLWWIWKNFPERLTNHPAYKLLQLSIC